MVVLNVGNVVFEENTRHFKVIFGSSTEQLRLPSTSVYKVPLWGVTSN